MSVIDVQSFLVPVSEESPCGEDLEYDPAFIALDQASQGKDEQQVGDSIIEAEDPDWKTVKTSGLEILTRTRDLRIAIHLTRALLRMDGFVGFADGLALVRGFLETFWDGLHPVLDPDDGNDPTFRVNTVTALADPDSTLRWIREAPLVSSRMLGQFGLRDIDIASGVISAPSDMDNVPETTAIDGAFMEIDVAELQATAEAVNRSIDDARAIEDLLTQLVGAANSADLSGLPAELVQAKAVLDDRLARRGVGEGAEGEEEGVEGGEAGGGRKPITGEISSREDVIRVLDKACDYFARNEPSSPVPLLLQRAKRLVSMNFLDIVKDLSPSGVPEVQNITGAQAEDSWT